MEKCIFLKAAAHTPYYIKQSALMLMMFLYLMWKGDCHLTLFPLAAWSTKNTFILIHAASFLYVSIVCVYEHVVHALYTVQIYILYVWQIHFCIVIFFKNHLRESYIFFWSKGYLIPCPTFFSVKKFLQILPSTFWIQLFCGRLRNTVVCILYLKK
jgi:hypothetical protein